MFRNSSMQLNEELTNNSTYDFHAHPVTDPFRQAMNDPGIDVIADDGFPLPKRTTEDHLRFMDEAGILPSR